jgi:hypothetical protein
MHQQQRRKQIGHIFVLSIASMLLLSGCGPAVTSLLELWSNIARVETSGQTEPVEGMLAAATASPEAALTTEPDIQRGEAVPVCPEIAQPAMLLFRPDDDYILFDPARDGYHPSASPLADPRSEKHM